MGRYDLSEEAKATDKELSSAADKLVLLSDEKIAELLPKRADQEELKRVIDAVSLASNSNAKRTAIAENLENVSEVVRKVMKAFM
ncbi:hypothetical protein ACLKZ7_03090 [Shewanella algae]|jgi:hypothetical protein|uniref:hypothetical protein n=1 Tax=Shewanella algae TaxID=38313 RepID=UPI00118355E9|nr:hypothetical protein [Shewanella algae]MBO2593044.1 hypothetical protein [Shewanella algae]TVL00763.1 hypothetical protein AYI83_01165 [Shewanella algae]